MDAKQQIEHILESIRPALMRDGGNIELVDVDEPAGVVKVRLQGACRGCPMSKFTLKLGVEAAITDALPQFKEVIDLA